MKRRNVLALAGLAATGTLSGCTGIGWADTSPERSPVAVVEQYFGVMEAHEQVDTELLHPETPNREQLLVTRPGAFVGAEEATVGEINVAEQDQEQALVSVEFDIEDGGEQIAIFQLRSEDGEWRLWDVLVR